MIKKYLLILVFLLYKSLFIQSICYESDLKFGREECVKNVNEDIQSEDIIKRRNCKNLTCTDDIDHLNIRVCIQQKIGKIKFIIITNTINESYIKGRFDVPVFEDNAIYVVKKIAIIGKDEKNLEIFLKIHSVDAVYQYQFNISDHEKAVKNLSDEYLGYEDEVIWQPLYINKVKKDVCNKISQPEMPSNNMIDINMSILIALISVSIALIIAIIILIIICCQKNNKSSMTIAMETKNFLLPNKSNKHANLRDDDDDQTARLLVKEDMEIITTLPNESKNFNEETLNWEKKRLINSGGYGKVYKCLYTNNNKWCYVAVKEPISSSYEAFNEEDIMKRITDHPNIVRLITTRIGNNMLLVMPLLMCSLSDFLQNDATRPTISKKIRYCQQITQGMAYLMFKRIVHCDLKASNILVVDENLVQIGDFGVSHKMGSRKETVGTLTHAAVEMLDSLTRKPNNEATDVWSFGVTLWEIFNETKQKPYADVLNPVNQVTLLQYLYDKNHLKTNFWPSRSTSEVLATIESLMHKCLCHRQESRPSFDKLFQSFTTMIPEGLKLKFFDEVTERSNCTETSERSICINPTSCSFHTARV